MGSGLRFDVVRLLHRLRPNRYRHAIGAICSVSPAAGAAADSSAGQGGRDARARFPDRRGQANVSCHIRNIRCVVLCLAPECRRQADDRTTPAEIAATPHTDMTGQASPKCQRQHADRSGAPVNARFAGDGRVEASVAPVGTSQHRKPSGHVRLHDTADKGSSIYSKLSPRRKAPEKVLRRIEGEGRLINGLPRTPHRRQRRSSPASSAAPLNAMTAAPTDHDQR